MKKIILLLAVLVSTQAFAQQEYKFNEAWFISGGAGTSTFFGDVAPVPKLTLKADGNEYKFGYMFRFGKKVIPAFDLNVEFLKCNYSGTKLLDAADNKYDRSFTGDNFTWSVNARIDVLKLFDRTQSFPFSFFGRIGVGGVLYRAILTRHSTGEFLASEGYLNEGKTLDRRSQATVVPYGFGLSYDFSNNLRLEAAVDLYNAFTDNLDAINGITRYNDKFCMISGSLVYGFDWDSWKAPKFKRQSPIYKN